MIEFNITASPDQDMVSSYTFYFEKFICGHNKKNHFFINDKAVKASAIGFRAGPNGVFVKNINQEFFWKNGKKVAGQLLLTIGDQIKIGETEITLSAYSYDSILKSANISERVEKAERENPHIEPTLRAIETELLILEKQLHD